MLPSRLRSLLRRLVGRRHHVLKAMVLIVRPGDGAVLVSECFSPSGVAFHRPLGGHVEFGERAADTAGRELEEEIGQAISDVTLAGVLENIFDWGDELQHEVVFVFSARFADGAAYEIDEQLIRDAHRPTRVLWREHSATEPPLYPRGVAELIGTVTPPAAG